MGITRGQIRRVVALSVSLAGMLLAVRPCAFALDPRLDVSQYAHVSWKIRDGFTKGPIFAIAQTPDGYLWLGTDVGLFRFDGVRAVPWQPPLGQRLPSDTVEALLAGRDGTLWIGTMRGLAAWKSGTLTTYPQLSGLLIPALLEDHEGTLWAGGFAYTPPGKLCAIQNGNLQCYGQDGTLGNGVLSLYEDTKQRIWAGVLNGFWQWKPGTSHFYPLVGEPYGIQGFAEDTDGALLVPISGRVLRLHDGEPEGAYVYPGLARRSHGQHILHDRDGGLWIATFNKGLIHMHAGNGDNFATSEGLSGDLVTALFEDREGNIWVATTKGLDRFGAYSVSTFSEHEGVSGSIAASVLAARDGSIWFNNSGRLARLNNRDVTVFHKLGSRNERIQESADRRVQGKIIIGLPTHDLASLFQDDSGRIWVAATGGVGYLQNEKFVAMRGVPGGVVYSMAGDTQGSLWISNFDSGLWHLFRGALAQRIPWAALGRNDIATALAPDHSQTGLWLGFSKGGLAHFRDGQIRESYTAADGLGQGGVSGLWFDHEGSLWIATGRGLSRLKDGRLVTLTRKDGLPCDMLHWVIEDADQALWLYGSCGLVRILRPELDAWVSNKNNDPIRTIKTTLLDNSDGVAVLGDTSSAPIQRPSKAPDGKIWFPTSDGLSVIDPRHIPFNKLPPPVHIEKLTADGKTYEPRNGLRLPPRMRDLKINYAAMSFVAPEKIHFRYKLEGQDKDWREVINDREVQYSNLEPRKYRFRVMASNNSGVWNEAGASLDFSVAPAYYQTLWFRSLCVLAFFGLLASAYLLRVRQMEQQFSMRMEARIAERTRIARDLHDTLLQSFHGLMFRFQAARNMLPRNPESAMRTLDEAISSTRAAITESRDAIHDLRSEPVTDGDLVQLLEADGEELASVLGADQNSPAFRVIVEGERQMISPALHDEVYRIAREVMRNAFRHAGAKKVEVEIRYDKSQLRLRVRDDGRGLDPKALEVSRRPGHWGLAGIHERAQQIGAELRIWSEDGAGTEIELTVPDITYKDVRNKSRFRLFRKERV